MNYNSKEELIGEFIDFMDTIELDSDKITKDNKEEVMNTWVEENTRLQEKIIKFMDEELKNV